MTKIHLQEDHSIVITIDDKPFYKIEPTVCHTRGPVLIVWRVHAHTNEHLMTLDVASWRAILRFLPVVINTAIRK